jgi:Alw26I/Eco31I/Esp3I family type II restriction endonuclease
MAKKKKTVKSWHPNFIKYMEFIANHKNYADMPHKFKKDGNIRWVASSNSTIGQEREKWWKNKEAELKVSSKAEAARKIHPEELNGLKPCQICGKSLKINYVYPNARTLKKINQIFKSSFQALDKDIFEIIDTLPNELAKWKTIFKLSKDTKITDYSYLKKWVQQEQVDQNSTSFLSPGVMCNPPDRFDGCHTYNACCRKIDDTGRSDENLASYTQDRRAYENWSDGDYNLANSLMGEFRKFPTKVKCPKCGKLKKMTADHIGPIALGFCHRPKFKPLCGSCNSGKGKRFTYEDICSLLNDETKGEQVVSWHSKYIWDNLKNSVKNDEDAKKLSNIMRENMHNVLSIFARISEKEFGKDFLKSLINTEYSFYKYVFNSFDPLNLDSLKYDKKPVESKNKEKNAERVVKIAFESLEEYKNKDNRRVSEWQNKEIDVKLEELYTLLGDGKNDQAKEKLHEILQILAQELTQDWEKDLDFEE